MVTNDDSGVNFNNEDAGAKTANLFLEILVCLAVGEWDIYACLYKDMAKLSTLTPLHGAASCSSVAFSIMLRLNVL
jgi:hypothetical protein